MENNMPNISFKIEASRSGDLAFRQDIGAEIHKRRNALRISALVMAEKLSCTEEQVLLMEQGELFIQMPRIRLECMVLLDELESDRDGIRYTELRLV